jgi:hypothetical protein
LAVKDFHEDLQKETVNQINALVEKVKSQKTEGIEFEQIKQEMLVLAQKVNTQDLVNLSSYIMYRKYVLDLFRSGLEFYKSNDSQNEEFFHNLLLQKHTDTSPDSNLWLLDDSFLYFEGTSEKKLQEIVWKNQKILRELNEEEERKVNAFNQRRLEKRIDLLLFPDERECVIIELKDPKVGVGKNASQTDEYVKWIANYIRPEFRIERFYTYLVTDNFDDDDFPLGYRKMYGLNGFVRPSMPIPKFRNGEEIASLYSEIISYTDIYERAARRHKIFAKKIGIQESP